MGGLITGILRYFAGRNNGEMLSQFVLSDVR